MVLGAGLAHGLDGLLHGEPEAVATGSADVVALHGGGAGQHDVGATGCGRPPWLVDDDGVGLLPRPQQHVDVGLLVEGIAPAPVEEMDVGVLHATPVEVVGLAGVQQHFADAGHGDEVSPRRWPPWAGRAGPREDWGCPTLRWSRSRSRSRHLAGRFAPTWRTALRRPRRAARRDRHAAPTRTRSSGCELMPSCGRGPG